MNYYDNTIEEVRKKYADIGVDFTTGKDETVICFRGKTAEELIYVISKQIPKRVLEDNFGRYYCPECGESLTDKTSRYCPKCGQAVIGNVYNK